MQRVRKILMACVLAGIGIFVAVFLFPRLFSQDNGGYTSEFNNHPARMLADLKLGQEEPDTGFKCIQRHGYTVENVHYISFGVYGDMDSAQLEQIADYVELYATGKAYVAGGGITQEDLSKFQSDLSKISLAFYEGDTEQLWDAFVWEDGRRRDFMEGEVYLPGYLTEDDYDPPDSGEGA